MTPENHPSWQRDQTRHGPETESGMHVLWCLVTQRKKKLKK